MLLPFLEELYINFSFAVYCDAEAGFKALNPIEVFAVEIVDQQGWSATYLLEHPNIDTVKVVDNQNSHLGGATLWISKIRANKCEDPIHDKLVNGRVPYSRIVPKRAAEAGYCYVSSRSNQEPPVSISISDGNRHYSGFLPLISDIAEQRFVLSQKSTSKILSEFVTLAAEPGVIRRSIWPEFSAYRCPESEVAGREFEFPFEMPRYQFLEDAITLAKADGG